jgi:hypothetical protein
MRRHAKWQRKLAGRISSARQLTFAWGSFDCAMWVCDWIRDMTAGAVDPGANYRGKYSSEAQAIAIFGTDLGAFAATVAASIGAKEVPPHYARRGDVVHVDNGTSYGALGIVNLDARFAMCVSQTGLVPVHMTKWKRAWQVG